MRISRRVRGDVVVLDVAGEFYGDGPTERLSAALEREGVLGTRRLVLNLRACTMMNSLTLGVLMRARRELEAIGCHLRLCEVGERLKGLLLVSRLITGFRVHDSESDAIGDWNSEAASA